MKTFKFLFILSFCFSFLSISAQVTFIIQSLPENTPESENVFIAGSFNGWNPGSSQYMMQKNTDGKWSITLAARAAGTVIEYKFTRGSWASVEKGSGGEEIANRTYTYTSGSATVNITITKWADASGGSNSTAAANVKIVSTDFNMPQLNRTRRIWMYFPPDYETSGIRYPVLYMHDGQNLFDATTSFSGEWAVDETLNNLASQGKRVPIVVGIDNGGGDRIGEYTPFKNTQYGGGDGEKYLQFIVETLKPYIDQHYRTLPGRETTGILGSSLGGLISHYGSLAYQETFSKAGLFSPSYWFSDSVWKFTHDAGKRKDMKFYQLCGTNESSSMVAEMQRMNDSLVKIGYDQANVFNKVVTGGQHNETLWREAFGDAYLWLFDSFVNSVHETIGIKTLECFPNPVENILTIRTVNKMNLDTVQIIDMNGRQIKTILHSRDGKINVNKLLPGNYIIKCVSGKDIYEAKFIKK